MLQLLADLAEILGGARVLARIATMFRPGRGRHRVALQRGGQCERAAGLTGPGRTNTVPDMSHYAQYAESNAETAAERYGEDKQTDAIGEGLAAVAYALLEVAAAIRDGNEKR